MKNWEKIKLGDLCEVITKGTTPTSIGYNFTDSGIKFIKVESLTESGEIIPNKVAYIDEACHQALKRSQLKKNDILFSIAGALGRIGIVKEDILPANTNQALAIIRLKKDSNAIVEFIAKYFNSNIVTDEIEKLRIGAAQQNLSLTQLNNLFVPLPPLHEQQRIVSILDEAFAAIAKAKANAEQNLKNTKELFESYLQDVFENGNNDWEVKCLDELGTITSSKRIYKSEYVKDGVPFYRTKEIKELSNGKPITLELFISRERYEQIKKSFGVPQIGDLLISAVGTIGEIMVIENEDEFYFKDGNIVWFKDFHQLDTNYLKYALTAFVEKIKSLAIGAAYSALTIEKLNKYEIAFPKTKTEQQTIVRQLDALRAETQKLEAVYQKKIDDLEELKKSILQKAFAGELKTKKALQ